MVHPFVASKIQRRPAGATCRFRDVGVFEACALGQQLVDMGSFNPFVTHRRKRVVALIVSQSECTTR